MHQQLSSQPVLLHMLNATSGRHSPRTKFHLMLLVWFPRYVYVSILLPLIPFEPTDHFQANLTEISAKRVSSHKLHDGFCPGFGWDRVNFLPSSWYSAVVWISCENNVDNMLMV